MGQISYVGNNRSREVHSSDCWWSNQIVRIKEFTSLKEVVFQGYDACGHCLTEYNGFINSGYLHILKPFPDIKGEFILPGIVLKFSKDDFNNGKSFKIVIELNKKNFEVLLEENVNDYNFKVTGNKDMFDVGEQVILKKFWKALSKEFADESDDDRKHAMVIGKTVALMLTLPESVSIKKNRSKSPVQATRQQQITKAFEGNPDVGSSVNGKKAIDFIGNDCLDNTNYVQERRVEQHVYKGESVQGWWKDENNNWKKSWCVVGGENGESNFGAAGCPDLFGDIDLFVGWFYGSVDHDMCQPHEDNSCFGPCLEELALASFNFVACMYFDLYNGNNPPDHMKITAEELKQRYYSYDQDHPMAGRKIDTPSNWTVNYSKKRWEGPPVPTIESVKATPEKFTQDTGTTIEIDFDEEAFVTIKLFAHNQTNAVKPEIILSKNCHVGVNYLHWDGLNSSGFLAESGPYTAIILVNGFTAKEIYSFVEFDGTITSADDIIKEIKVSPNPFSKKNPPTISFSLKEKARVEAYIYHINWNNIPTGTLIRGENYEKDVLHPCKWDCENDLNLEALNGGYKIRFIVNGKTRLVEGLEKTASCSGVGDIITGGEKIEGITISPNPFSIESRPVISFRLNEDAEVSIYIFHTNWKKPAKTIIEKKYLKKRDKKYTYTWNCKNNKKIPVTNGFYKVRIVVNGKVRIVDKLIKLWEWQL